MVIGVVIVGVIADLYYLHLVSRQHVLCGRPYSNSGAHTNAFIPYNDSTRYKNKEWSIF